MNKEAIGTLTGKFFHSVQADRTTFEWQGTFLGLASPGLYRVQLFDGLHGQDSDQILVPAMDMRYWRIYDTAEEMRAAWEKYYRRVQVREAIQAREAIANGGAR